MSIFRNKKRGCSALLAGVLMSLAAWSAVRADEPTVLTQVPADANAVIVINNVHSLSTKLSNAITRLGLPIPIPPDLAGFALRNIGVTGGFDDNSSAALVVLKPAAGATIVSGPPQLVILLPTTDPKAMLQNLSPGAPDATGISEVALPGNAGDKGYVVTVDKWVALAQTKETLTSYLGHKGALKTTLPPETLKSFSDNDIVLWSNLGAIGGALDKYMEDKQQEFTGMLDLMNLNNNQDPTAGALQKEAVNLYFSGTKQFLNDAQNGLFTMRLSDSGVTLGLVGGFKADSPFGKFVAAQKTAAPLTLEGLPNGDLLSAGAFSYDPQSVADLVSTIGKQVLANEQIAQDPKIADYKAAVEGYKQVILLSNGIRYVLLRPADVTKNGILNGALITQTTDPVKFLAESLKLQSGPLANTSMNPDIKQTTTVTENAITVKDIKFSKIHVAFTLREETPDHPLAAGSKQGVEIINKMYGADGITAYMGIVGKNTLTVFGSDPATIDSAVAAAQGGTDILSATPAIASVKDQIVPNAVAFAYFPVSRFVELAQSIMRPGETAVPPAPAAGAPVVSPVVFSAGVTGSTLTAEYHIPISAITSTIESVTKLRQAMQGGPVPPAPVNP